jgi:predicted DNA-binding protein
MNKPTRSIASHTPKSPSEKEPTVRFTVDMPKSLHQKFSLLAVIQGRDKAVIVRELLTELVKDITD